MPLPWVWTSLANSSCCKLHPSLEHFQGQRIHNFPEKLQSSVLPDPFFLTSSLKLPSFSLKLLLLLLLLLILMQSLFLSVLRTSFIYWQAAVRSSWSLPDLFQGEPQLSQPFVTGQVFQPFDFSWPFSESVPTGPCPSCAWGPQR